jgi:protein ImuB
MPFACIFVPNFPVAAIFRAEPELRAQAVAIFEGKPPLEKVFAVNENAGRAGISPGMTKAQAELCSELTLRPRSPLQESATHAALLDCAQSFSPCVEDAAADTAILDLAGMESLFGTLPEIARNLFRCAADLGLDGNVAVASNPDAAALAARGFSDVTLLPSGKEAECLGSLPVEVLFADQAGDESKASTEKKGKEKISELKKNNEMLETLDRWGVRNLRALAALPEIALSERLGQEGLRLQQLARGAASRTLVPIEAPTVFEEAIELEFPIVLLEPLAFQLNRLLDQICARLSARALHTQELRLTLELQNLAGINPELETFGIPSESDEAAVSQSPAQHFVSGRQSKFCRTLRLPLPMLDPKLFLKLLQLDLNAHPPGAPIIKIHLIAEPARPRSAQGGLFLPPSPEPEKLELTLARIAGLVGESRVGSLELLDTHSAESFRMRRFVVETAPPDKLQKTSEPAEEEKSPVAALRTFRPPLRASVTLENGEPLRVACSKKKEVQDNVLWKAGPWRSSGDWWERKAWARDEWDIALQNRDEVALYRLVHDLLGGGWFVEGTYD